MTFGLWALIRRSLHISVFAAVLFQISCGYQILQSDRPFGIASLSIEPFDEDIPLGLSPILQDELVRLFASDGVKIQSVFSSDGSTQNAALLRGKIISARTTASPVKSVDAAISAYEVRLEIQAELLDSRGETLWQFRLRDN